MAKKKGNKKRLDAPPIVVAKPSLLRKFSPLVIAILLLVPFLLIFIPLVIEQMQPVVHMSSISTQFPEVSSMPVSKNIPVPQVSARHVFIMDQLSRVVMYSHGADDKVYPASTTKMMTALVVLDYFDLKQPITVSREYPIGQFVGFQVGEKIDVENLLYALLVQSGNDAAEILAENYPGGRAQFIEAMNQKAKELHLNNTHFSNPTGIDEDNHYSTAIDLARLGDFALRNSEFAKIVATENAVVSTTDHVTSYVIKNVNELLGKVIGVRGIKTGYTEGAGQSLVTLVERDGHPVILVVLGSDDRFKDTQVLIDWIYTNFHWQVPSPHIQETQPTQTP